MFESHSILTSLIEPDSSEKGSEKWVKRPLLNSMLFMRIRFDSKLASISDSGGGLTRWLMYWSITCRAKLVNIGVYYCVFFLF